LSPPLRAIGIGLARGWTMFGHLWTSPEGVLNTVFWNGIPLAFLILNRDSTIEGSPLPFATVVLPGFLGLMVAASAMSPAFYLSAEREDGTLLRAKAVPHGMVGYVTGMLLYSSLETLVGVALLLGAGLILFPGLAVNGVGGWIMFTIVLVLGLLATLPVGIAIGSVVRSARAIGGFGLIVIGGMAAISGIFIPTQALWGWLQVLAQALPTYWLGQGMRFAFLPDSAAAWEIGASWRLIEMFTVLGAWAVAGVVLAPVLLRRMARRESGSAVEARRQQALQRF
jgi:ABC-2 type transport system permease protein